MQREHTQMKTAFFNDEWCYWHSGGMYSGIFRVGGWVQVPSSTGHAESPETKRRLRNLLDVTGLLKQMSSLSAEPASDEDLLRIHPQHYLDKFKQVSDAGGGELGYEAPIGPGSYEIAKLSAGLACAAVEKVYTGEFQNAYALSRPPGHHCLPDESMGFCFLANIPVAIERAKAKFGLGKVVVLDWDVHHGNGTQHIYYNRDDVLTISIHQDKCFPPGYSGDEDRGEGAGEGYNINIPMYAGAGHEEYLHAFKKIILPAIEQFEPEMIVVACGYDANDLDPLARMMLHSDSFREMTKLTKQMAEKVCDGKLVLVHEGGYSESYVPFCGLAVIEELTGIKTAVEDDCKEFITLQQQHDAFKNFQKQRIDQLAEYFGYKQEQLETA